MNPANALAPDLSPFGRTIRPLRDTVGRSVYTDGCAVVAIDGEAPAADARLEPKVESYLWPEAPILSPLDLGALRAWLLARVPIEPLPPPARVKCRSCDGTGRATERCYLCSHEHEHDCADCGGTGTVEEEAPTPSVPILRLGGETFDGRRLALALAELPGDAGEYAILDGPCLHLRAPGWRFALMACRTDDGDTLLGSWPKVHP